MDHSDSGAQILSTTDKFTGLNKEDGVAEKKESIHSTIKIQRIKKVYFDGTNYKDWAVAITLGLLKKGLFRYVKTDIMSKRHDEDLKAWETRKDSHIANDEMARGRIGYSLGKQYWKCVENFESAFEVWGWMRSTFDNLVADVLVMDPDIGCGYEKSDESLDLKEVANILDGDNLPITKKQSLSDLSDYAETHNKVRKVIRCWCCGENGHKSSECYLIIAIDYDAICSICHKKGHSYDFCYSEGGAQYEDRYSLQKKMFPDKKEKKAHDTLPKAIQCWFCGKKSHKATACYFNVVPNDVKWAQHKCSNCHRKGHHFETCYSRGGARSCFYKNEKISPDKTGSDW